MQEVIFKDGTEVRRLKGKIIDEKGSFVTIDTKFKRFRINKDFVIKIEEEL